MAASSSSSSSSSRPKFALVLCCWLLLWSSRNGGCNGDAAVTATALYVFGDSLADVGNNNHLGFSLLKADFPHNGVDFPGCMPTGRFSNGKNTADFLAEKIGLATSAPHLSIPSSFNQTTAFLSGLSFASGGAGILDSTNSGQCISFNKQIDYFSTVYEVAAQQLGSEQAQAFLAKSIISFIIGSNEIIIYVKSSQSNKLQNPPQKFIDSLILSLRSQLKRLYDIGGRKYAFLGTGPIGCCPSLRQLNQTGWGCNVEANDLSALYNKEAASLLKEMNSELADMSYSFFDTSMALLQYINNPAAYGFVEVEAACCGLGDLNAKLACLPISSLCSNRKDHLFWDLYHPTEATADMLAAIAVDGSFPFLYPLNIRQLITI